MRRRFSHRSADIRFDTFAHFEKDGAERVWELDVEDGDYRVVGVVGDAEIAANEGQSLLVEGQPALSPNPFFIGPAFRWTDFDVTVTVSDGRLTVASDSTESTNVTKLDFVAVYALQIPSSDAAVERLEVRWHGGGKSQPDAVAPLGLQFPPAPGPGTGIHNATFTDTSTR